MCTGTHSQSMISAGLYGKNGPVICLRERIAKISNKKEV
jgi:hypothetical protein